MSDNVFILQPITFACKRLTLKHKSVSVICIFVNPRAGKGKRTLICTTGTGLVGQNMPFTVYTGYWPETLAGC